MSTDHRGNPLMSLGGAEPHLHKISRLRMQQSRVSVGRELREMGGGEVLMHSDTPASVVRDYDNGYEGERQGPSY